MDQDRSHIKDHFFSYPVPRSPMDSNIFLQLSWGFRDYNYGWYISTTKDADPSKVSQDPTLGGRLVRNKVRPSSTLQELLKFWPETETIFPSPLQLLSSASFLSSISAVMDASSLVTLLTVLMAMADFSQALHLQSGLDKSDISPDSVEENMAEHLLGLVRR